MYLPTDSVWLGMRIIECLGGQPIGLERMREWLGNEYTISTFGDEMEIRNQHGRFRVTIEKLPS